jgi:hypothetical protein
MTDGGPGGAGEITAPGPPFSNRPARWWSRAWPMLLLAFVIIAFFALMAAERLGTADKPLSLSSRVLTTEDLAGKELRGAILVRSRLDGLDLSNRDLRSAVLVQASLRGALLVHADLRGADLANADLRSADLTHADLAGADLTGACLAGTVLAQAVVAGALMPLATPSPVPVSPQPSPASTQQGPRPPAVAVPATPGC